ncbi:hypothetical protein GCM10010172_85480 [Paractinoplanes ferrugineus]|uniref:Uncharacterized protein n=1 Tax=Paractinoplanes ferrugineus TaxID=113564 RepID=A0A919MGY9_9ACTN|nr:hypothetical protein [Actinoplanes ferrugineus]GIE15288.1 hypothetical protein Afe05nite_71280 [Actinoplanes ferrugineus]
MRLTGMPLIAMAVGSTVIVAFLTVLVWGRPWRLRLLLRPAGVLLTEASLLVSVGLVVNRHEDFYPTWDSLFSTGDVVAPTYATAAGGLDQELAARAAGRTDRPLSLPWQPTGWTDWHLASAPVLVVPAGYLQHPQWRYSVVLVVGSAGAGWPASWPEAPSVEVAAAAGRDVVVYLSTTSGTEIQTLAAGVPVGLHHDLRVTDHRWALVGSPADTRLVRQVSAAAPGQFPAVASVRAEVPPVPHDVVVPAGVATFTVRPGVEPAGVLRAVRAAVGWAAGQTPPPLAASSPPVKSLPVHRRPKPGASSGPPGAPVPPGTPGRAGAGAPAGAPSGKEKPHGPGQPWR